MSRTKYRNTSVTHDGFRFDSKAELKRYQELKWLEQAGAISGLERQKEYLLIPAQPGERKVSYRADFVYRENGQQVVEDVKGMKTKDYVIKRKLMLFMHGIRIREITK